MYQVISPETVFIGNEVVVGEGAVIHPGNVLSGKTVIGAGAVLFPGNIVEDSTVGARAELIASVLRGAAVGKESKVGPFANLRAGTKVGENCRIGDFVELKNAEVGDGCKVCHLAYVGDAVLGRGVNVGCGAVFCNFDGVRKHFTYVGDGAFIGSNVNLVAPVRVGARAFIAAGTTVTRDVAEGACVIGRVRDRESEGLRKRREKKDG